MELCNTCNHSVKKATAEKLVATWECVVTERDGDRLWCDAHPLDGSDDTEFWEIVVPGNKWDEGHAFYVLRPESINEEIV